MRDSCVQAAITTEICIFELSTFPVKNILQEMMVEK